jgi:hypothetical protein
MSRFRSRLHRFHALVAPEDPLSRGRRAGGGKGRKGIPERWIQLFFRELMNDSPATTPAGSWIRKTRSGGL